MQKYVTFLRSARSYAEFANAEKVIQETCLTLTEAREACFQFNVNRSDAQMEAGTMMEFTATENFDDDVLDMFERGQVD